MFCIDTCHRFQAIEKVREVGVGGGWGIIWSGRPRGADVNKIHEIGSCDQLFIFNSIFSFSRQVHILLFESFMRSFSSIQPMVKAIIPSDNFNWLTLLAYHLRALIFFHSMVDKDGISIASLGYLVLPPEAGNTRSTLTSGNIALPHRYFPHILQLLSLTGSLTRKISANRHADWLVGVFLVGW